MSICRLSDVDHQAALTRELSAVRGASDLSKLMVNDETGAFSPVASSATHHVASTLCIFHRLVKNDQRPVEKTINLTSSVLLIFVVDFLI